MIEFKKISEDRWKEYRDLRLEALQQEPLAFSESYEDTKNMPENAWRSRIDNILFAFDEDKLIGMIGFFRVNEIKCKHVANIYGVYVKKEYRCKGVGKRLIEAMISQIQQYQDIIKIQLGVNPVQKTAVKLYEDFGFTVIGRMNQEIYVEDKFYDELLMEKFL